MNKKIYLSLLIFITVSFCLFVFIIPFLFSGIKKDSQEMLAQKKNINSIQVKVENIEEFKDFYSKAAPNLEKASNLFIDPEFPVDFIHFLEEISQNHGILIDISLFTVRKDEEEEDFWNFLSFQITSTASFLEFLIFLEKIESGPYLISIQSLNIKRLSEDDVKTLEENIFANLVIKVYTK